MFHKYGEYSFSFCLINYDYLKMSQNHRYLTGINRPALQSGTDHLLSDAAAVPVDLVTCSPVKELHLSLLQSDHMLAYST